MLSTTIRRTASPIWTQPILKGRPYSATRFILLHQGSLPGTPNPNYAVRKPGTAFPGVAVEFNIRHDWDN